MNDYNFNEEAIVYVEIIFRQKDKKLLSEFHLIKPSHVTKSEVFNTEKYLNVPLPIS